jgi:hypothetical protein
MKPFALPTAMLIAAAILWAADPPFVKEGYWSIHTVSTDQPKNEKTESTKTICRNHAYEQYVRDLAKKAAVKCKTITDDSSTGVYKTESECTAGTSVIHTKGTATYSDTASHSESTATYTPPLYGLSGMTMIQDQKYLGACPAGVEPGDMIGADGKKINSWRH